MDVINSTILQAIGKNGISLTFSWYDYILFSVMLSLSAAIGIYFGCFGSKQSTSAEYLLGNKKMKVIPVAVSLVASHMSGITLLAVPADLYRYGATYWWSVASTILVALCTIYIFLPVFYNLGITSTYEYLEKRFDKSIRMFASFLFALGLLLYLPIVIYIPALAFSASTGINVHYIALVVCGICIFYTTLGGLKAVVWTDTLQFTVTIGALITVIVIGVNAGGGLGAIWETSVRGDRLSVFDFDPDPTKRDSFWIVVIGVTFSWLASTGVHQSCVQKYLSLSSLRDAKMSVLFFTIGVMIVATFSVMIGLIMYGRYADCDPFTAGLVEKYDQLIPFYIMDAASDIPGLPGLFIAGIFSAALSTLSASLNCVAGTIYEDFISKLIKPVKSEERAAFILKLLVVITGVLSTAMIFVIERLGGLLPLTLSFSAITGGPLLGMFFLGVLFPKASSKGTLFGSIGGLISISTIFIMAQYYKVNGYIIDSPKPVSTAGCPADVYNSTTLKLLNSSIVGESETFEPFYLFRISFFYYAAIGTISTIIFGLILSALLPNNDPPVRRDLLSPVIYPFLKKK